MIILLGFETTLATTTDGRGSPIPRTGSPDRTRSRSTSPLRRNLSPSRAALDESASAAAEVDPEAVRLALRDYVTVMAATERERDDAQAQVRAHSKINLWIIVIHCRRYSVQMIHLQAGDMLQEEHQTMFFIRSVIISAQLVYNISHVLTGT